MYIFLTLKSYFYKRLSFFYEFFLLMLVWLVSAGSIYLLFPVMGWSSSYVDAPLFFAAFYLCFIGFMFYYIIPKFTYVNNVDFGLTQKTLGMIVLSLAFIFGFYHFFYPQILSLAPQENSYLFHNFLSGRPEYLFVKMFEIGLQQILFYSLVKVFWNYSRNKKFVYFWVISLFTLAHFIIVFVDGLYLTPIFIVGAFVAGKIFTYLSLNYKNGFVYSYLTHWLLYILFSFFIIFYLSI